MAENTITPPWEDFQTKPWEDFRGVGLTDLTKPAEPFIPSEFPMSSEFGGGSIEKMDQPLLPQGAGANIAFGPTVAPIAQTLPGQYGEFLRRIGQQVEGLSTVPNIALGLGTIAVPAVGVPLGLGFGGQSIYQGVQQMRQGATGAGAADVLAGGLMVGGAGLGAREMLRPGTGDLYQGPVPPGAKTIEPTSLIERPVEQKLLTETTKPWEDYAKGIRSNQGQLLENAGQEGQAQVQREGSQNVRGENLQQQASGSPESVGAREKVADSEIARNGTTVEVFQRLRELGISKEDVKTVANEHAREGGVDFLPGERAPGVEKGNIIWARQDAIDYEYAARALLAGDKKSWSYLKKGGETSGQEQTQKEKGPGIHINLGGRGEEGGVLPFLGAFDSEAFVKALGFAKNVKVQGEQLFNRVRNKIGETSSEWKMLEPGLAGFLKGQERTPEEVGKWIGENGPRIEVQSYGMEGKVSEGRRELDNLKHEVYDSLTQQGKAEIYAAISGQFSPDELIYKKWGLAKGANSEYETKLRRFIELSKESERNTGFDLPAGTSPRATSAYDRVSALPANEPMPEWTTSKEGKNVQRVDVVIPQGVKPAGARMEELLKEGYTRAEAREEIESNPEKQAIWQPDNLHENLPNTLGWAMIQYKTGPKGEKIAVINEVQSRWGQSVREAKQTYGESMGERHTPSHPLLQHYNRLILKAAIEQARKEGATHIALSDAETAMMTEGHDLQVARDTPYIEQATKEELDDLIGQAKGMRLNYDQVLPKMLEELTGSKGEKVSLGEHKNAFRTLSSEQRGTSFEGTSSQPRENLIFKNEQGQPKTDITARLYDLSNVEPGKFTLTGTDKAKKGINIKLGSSETGATTLHQVVADAIKENYDKIKAFAKSGKPKETMSQLLDASDNLARIAGRREGNRVRVGLRNEQGDYALKYVIEAGNDPKQLDVFLGKVRGKDAKAEEQIRYAKANWATLKLHADAAAKRIEAQRQAEVAAGIDTSNFPNYIKHAYEKQGGILFDAGRGGSGIATGFKKQRTFATYADAVEAGMVPKNVRTSDLIESRVAAGQKLINRQKWGTMLGSLKDPTTSEPIAKDLIKQPKGTFVAPKGYSVREVLPGTRVAIKDEYTGIFDSLLGESDVRRSMFGRALLATEGGIKHGLLMFDTFHASRISQKQAFLTGKVGYQKGLSLLEYDQPTITRLVNAGDLPPEALQYYKANKANSDLLLRNGLNVGRIAEALNADVIRKELPVLGIDVNIAGRFNKWVFDKLTRGAMMQSALVELERARKSNPSAPPEQLAQQVARQINTYFGNLQRQGLFKSTTKRDILQLAFLAPQWVESMARTEAGAIGQTLASPFTRRVGTLAKGVGVGLLAYLVGTQILNQFTRGKFTWENPEKEHKLDAWIPDVTGKTPGYWLSPFSVAMELTHDVLRYSRTKTPLEVGSQIVANKMSPLARTEETLRTQRDYAGNKLLGTGEVLKQAGRSILPVPLPVSGLTADREGQTQRQLIGSAGLKVEPVSKGEEREQAVEGKTLRERAQKPTPEPLSLQRRFGIAQKATEHEFERLQKLEGLLSKENRDFLQQNNLRVRGVEPQVSFGGGRVTKLTQDETDRLLQLTAGKYDEMINKMRDRGVVTQQRLDTLLEIARKRALIAFRRQPQKEAVK